MEMLTAERHPDGLIAPLIRQDWETTLTVILHSPALYKESTFGGRFALECRHSKGCAG
jgi:hypothetical protein